MSGTFQGLRACKTPSCQGSLTLRVVAHATIAVGQVDVGRCMTCDTMPCAKCKGRTFDPTAKKCQHCGASIAIEIKPSDEVKE